MKKFFFALWLIPLAIISVACGSGEYDQAIDEAIEYHHENRGGLFATAYEYETRENANVVVHDNGKYIFLSFFDPNEDMKEGKQYYYERAGDTWSEMPQYEGQALMSKTPVYQEQMGEGL